MPNFVNKNRKYQTIASIDLGSNALRASVARISSKQIEIIRNFREPLRLGEDVFKNGLISEEKMRQTEEAFIRLFHMFIEYNVSEVSAYATSAMRESANADELQKRILHSTGIEVRTITGSDEACLILEAVKGQVNLDKTALLVDVGGGSTELIIIRKKEILGLRSFDVGTVRLIQYKNPHELEVQIDLQIKEMVKFIREQLGSQKPQIMIGTGGNLRRIGKIRKAMLKKRTSQMIYLNEVAHMKEAILSMSYIERIRQLELEENRADVILPAIMLVHHLMNALKMNQLVLPKVGLKEGMILSMVPNAPEKFILKE
jgi:exopolyphosphatase / guanosine-5'-triphosphate,3'-diphosphate pyrophosphatase